MSACLKTFLAAAMCGFVQLASVPALAGEPEYASEDDAQEMVREAVDLLKTQGPARAYDTFTSRPGSTFKDRDLYIVVFDFNGTCLAHGADPKMVGRHMTAPTDAEGQQALQGELTLVKAKGDGWYGPYNFADPVSRKTEVKKSYCKRGAGDTVVCAAVGAQRK